MAGGNTARKRERPPSFTIYYNSYADDQTVSLKTQLDKQAQKEGISTSLLCVRYLREGLARSVDHA